MRIRSFMIAYGLVLAILLFAERRPNHDSQQARYSHVVDLTTAGTSGAPSIGSDGANRTQIVAPDSLIPGTWTAGQIPPERLIAPLVVMDLNVAPPAQIGLDDIANWESQHGAVPQGAVVAIRRLATAAHPATASANENAMPISDDAAQFLMDARYTIGFAVDSAPDFRSDRTLAQQLALHGSYVVEHAARLSSIPATGSLIIVAPNKVAPNKLAPDKVASEKGKKSVNDSSLRVLAMVR